MLDPRLDGKIVFITGANHGIGAATARTLASQGARVFITYYRDTCPYSQDELDTARKTGAGGPLLYTAMQQQPVDGLLADIRDEGHMAFAQEADLSDQANIPLLFDCCEAELGPVDILINNHTYCVMETFDPARVTQTGFPISFINQVEIDRHMVINTRAYALLMAEYVQRYIRRGAQWGRIINISTDAAHAHEVNVSYAASKHAIESYSRSAAAELGQYGITVNIVAPGPIQTGYLSPENAADIAAHTPLRRVGEPLDVADVITFLASEQAHWLTGQLLYVGGGWRMGQ